MRWGLFLFFFRYDGDAKAGLPLSGCCCRFDCRALVEDRQPYSALPLPERAVVLRCGHWFALACSVLLRNIRDEDGIRRDPLVGEIREGNAAHGAWVRLYALHYFSFSHGPPSRAERDDVVVDVFREGCGVMGLVRLGKFIFHLLDTCLGGGVAAHAGGGARSSIDRGHGGGGRGWRLGRVLVCGGGCALCDGKACTKEEQSAGGPDRFFHGTLLGPVQGATGTIGVRDGRVKVCFRHSTVLGPG